MKPEHYRVIKDYKSPYPDPIFFKKGKELGLVKNSGKILIGRIGFGAKETTRRLGFQNSISISLGRMEYSTKTIMLWS